MEHAFQLAELALSCGEVPIGCVFVNKDTNQIIGNGRNRTNELYNATRHAEMEAIDDILLAGYDKQIFSNCILYVTVEPCIMCTAALRLLNVSKIVFGCYNDRFGGCGSTLNMNNDPISNFSVLNCIQDKENENRAIILLRKFYLRENQRAPKPKRKVNRALKLP